MQFPLRNGSKCQKSWVQIRAWGHLTPWTDKQKNMCFLNFDPYETGANPTESTQNLTPRRFWLAEAESDVKNLRVSHPDLEMKENHLHVLSVHAVMCLKHDVLQPSPPPLKPPVKGQVNLSAFYNAFQTAQMLGSFPYFSLCLFIFGRFLGYCWEIFGRILGYFWKIVGRHFFQGKQNKTNKKKEKHCLSLFFIWMSNDFLEMSNNFPSKPDSVLQGSFLNKQACFGREVWSFFWDCWKITVILLEYFWKNLGRFWEFFGETFFHCFL